MRYMGGKKIISGEILPIMLKHRKPGQTWVEPFVGGANMIELVTGDRIGGDVNPYAIEALKLVRDSPEKIPRNNREYTKEMYLDALVLDSMDPVDCFAYFSYSFGGKFKSSWAKNRQGYDYVKSCVKSAHRQSEKLKGVPLYCAHYKDLKLPRNSIIYCDPPYEGTTSYAFKFDHVAFWQWVREKTEEGHTVFVSEYSAPEDFICIWEKEINTTMNNTQKTRSKLKPTEKLFIFNDLL